MKVEGVVVLKQSAFALCFAESCKAFERDKEGKAKGITACNFLKQKCSILHLFKSEYSILATLL